MYFRDNDPVVGRAAAAKRKLKLLEETYGANIPPFKQIERAVLMRASAPPAPTDTGFFKLDGDFSKRMRYDSENEKVYMKVESGEPPPPLPAPPPAMSTRSRTAAASNTAPAAAIAAHRDLSPCIVIAAAVYISCNWQLNCLQGCEAVVVAAICVKDGIMLVHGGRGSRHVNYSDRVGER